MKTRFPLLLTALMAALIILTSACQSQPAATSVVPQQDDTPQVPSTTEESSGAQAGQPTRIAEAKPTKPKQSNPSLPLPTEEPGKVITEGFFLHSDKARIVPPETITDDMKILAEGNNVFTFDLYPLLQPKDKNFVYSPYSVSSVLAMALVGARGETAKQMADILHFDLPEEQIHPAYNAIEDVLINQNKASDGSDSEGFALNVANSVWGQQNRPVLNEFLDTLSEYYGAGLYVVDFAVQPEAARKTINDWVSQRTQQKIQDLFAPGSITPMTNIVLANAVYLKADWLYPFNPGLTDSDYFFFLVGGQTRVKMMHNTETYAYKKVTAYEVIALPYQGENEEMVIIMPTIEEYANIEKDINVTKLNEIIDGLEPQKIELTLPQFHLESSFAMRDVLIEMGMLNAFAPFSANFSGIDGTRDLYIDKLEHETFLQVDEFGTEAAAASGAALGLTALDETSAIPVVINHPFIFVIKDKQTGLILFIGRVLNPAKIE